MNAIRTQLPARTTGTSLVPKKNGTQVQRTTTGSVTRAAPSGPVVYYDIGKVVRDFGGHCRRSWFTERMWAEFRSQDQAFAFAQWCEDILVVRTPTDIFVTKQGVYPPTNAIPCWHVPLLSAEQQGRSTTPEIDKFINAALPHRSEINPNRKSLLDLVAKWLARLVEKRVKPLLLGPPVKKLPAPREK